MRCKGWRMRVWNLPPPMMNKCFHTELSSPEGTRCQFNGGRCAIKLGIEQEEGARAIHRQREQLVTTRKVLEAQGRSLMVNHGLEPVQKWWKERTFATLCAPQWIRELLQNSQPILLALQGKDPSADPSTASGRP